MQTNGEHEQHGKWFVTHNSSRWYPHTSSVKYQHYMLDASSNGLSPPKFFFFGKRVHLNQSYEVVATF